MRWIRNLILGAFIVCLGLSLSACSGRKTDIPLNKSFIGRVFSVPFHRYEFPKKVTLPQAELETTVQYSFDLGAQLYIQKLFESYKPDYGAFVAIDAETGRVLTLVSHIRGEQERELLGNLALRANFPAASIFKIVTATAAIDQGRAEPETSVSFHGANHTLYRRNVHSEQVNRWTRHMSLSEAFAKSVNTVFAKVGLNMLAPLDLQNYAERFLFNRWIAGDLISEAGQFSLPEHSRWAVAEAASGFNRFVGLSPLQGALIAAGVANDGVIMEPFVIDELSLSTGEPIYRAERQSLSVAMSQSTSIKIREMMQQTVTKGTSRKAFRDLRRQTSYRGVEIGGKTGSLQGKFPSGKYDWFVGYGIDGERRVAVAALTINIDEWRVKASYLSCKYLENYFKRPRRFLANTER